jgi:hypothetical protein
MLLDSDEASGSLQNEHPRSKQVQFVVAGIV